MTNICCPNLAGSGIVFGGSATVSNPNDIYDGLIFCLPLDELESPYLDHTRNNLDGTAAENTTPVQDVGLFCTNSQHFNGGQFISLPVNTLQLGASFTLTLWGKIEGFFNGDRAFYSMGHDDPQLGRDWVFSLGYNNINQLVAEVQVVKTAIENGEYFVSSSTELTEDTWYHLAAVYSPGSLKIYINGVLSGTATSTYKVSVPQSNGGYIGRWNDAARPVGNIQEVRLWSEAKDVSWLLAEYNNLCGNDLFDIGTLEDI